MGALAEEPQRQRHLVAEVDATEPHHEIAIASVRARLLALGESAIRERRVLARLGDQPIRERRVLLRRHVLVARARETTQQRGEIRIGPTEGGEALEPEVEQVLTQEHEHLGVGADAQGPGQAELDPERPHETVTGVAIGHEHVHACFHLGRRLLHEGEGEDLFGSRPLRRDEPGDAARDHGGLAGAGPGDDEQGAVAVRHGSTLLVVQPVEDRADRGAEGLLGQAHARTRAGRGSHGA